MPTERNWTNVQGISAFTGLSIDFFNKDRVSGLIGIPFAKVGKRILYNISEVDAFLKSRTVIRCQEVQQNDRQ